ncbi:MAG: 3-isopropylmalate dehydratase small subunit [Alphaproteobacteria bacterium]
MEAFTTFHGPGIPIDISNCDTDQIIPARFLSRMRTDEGYDRYLFHDLRYAENGSEKPDFIYNKNKFRDATILVADINWGCGSSREQAVYALVANGFRCVIAPSFGDIHFNNCVKQGVLPVRLPDGECRTLRRQLHKNPGSEIAIDLEAQSVTGPDGKTYSFDIQPFDKHRLLNGVDDIDMTLGHNAEIEAFEENSRGDYSWLGR